MKELYEHIQLSELGLELPPKGGGEMYRVRICVEKNHLSGTSEKNIIVQNLYPFGFIFCFSNKNTKHDPLRYALHATVIFGPLTLKTKDWQPPSWTVQPLGRNKQIRVIKRVNWSSTYHERFENHSEKERLKTLLLQKTLNIRQQKLNL